MFLPSKTLRTRSKSVIRNNQEYVICERVDKWAVLHKPAINILTSSSEC